MWILKLFLDKPLRGQMTRILNISLLSQLLYHASYKHFSFAEMELSTTSILSETFISSISLLPSLLIIFSDLISRSLLPFWPFMSTYYFIDIFLWLRWLASLLKVINKHHKQCFLWYLDIWRDMLGPNYLSGNLKKENPGRWDTYSYVYVLIMVTMAGSYFQAKIEFYTCPNKS